MADPLKPEEFADYLRQHAALQRPNVRAELEHIANEVQAMRQEADDEDTLRTRMAQLLTDTANALKGAPAELHRHSWHDLPEIAAQQADAATLLRARQALGAARDALYNPFEPDNQSAAWHSASEALEDVVAGDGAARRGAATSGEALLPCPFCGRPVDDDLSDTLYQSGTYWREDEGFRHYISRRERRDGDQPCWSMHCVSNGGGCGAQITADSEPEVRAAWNRRAAQAEPRALPHEVLRWIDHDLRIAGCECAKPLLGWKVGGGPRCRLCNTQAYKVTQR
jgi:hypothetical protein